MGHGSPVFIVAEAGINHNGDVEIAKNMIFNAKKAGADAIKFQTFEASDLCSVKSKYFKIFKELELDESDFGELSDYAKSLNMIFFSTPFSTKAVDVLHRLRVPAYKIASGDLTNLPLIKYAAAKKKPIIISTGMANLNEVGDAVKTIQSAGNKNIIIMHSVSAYPTPPEDANLKVIHTLSKKFLLPIGYSDNGSNMLVPLVSVALGARIIEKHFTINKKMKGPDHKLSSDSKEFSELIKKIRLLERMLGNGIKKCQQSEMKNRIYARRSITANMNIEKGTKITKTMIALKRPATGIEPKYFHTIIGKKVKRRISLDHSIKWEYLI